MTITTTIRELHEKFRAKVEIDAAPIPGFSADELAQLEAACGHALPPDLQTLLRTAGVFAAGPEVFIEDVGYFCTSSPETIITDATNLRTSAESYGWELPACCSLSLVNNGFIAYDLENKTVIAIDGDDGEVTELAVGLEGFLTQFAGLYEAQIDAM